MVGGGRVSELSFVRAPASEEAKCFLNSYRALRAGAHSNLVTFDVSALFSVAARLLATAALWVQIQKSLQNTKKAT